MRNMQGFLRRISMLLAAVMLLMLVPVPVQAQENHLVCVSAQEMKYRLAGDLVLLNCGGMAYITREDAQTLSNADSWEELPDGGISYTFGNATLTYDGQSVQHDGVTYYPLKELMDALHCRYTYQEYGQALVFAPGTAFAQNLYADCEEIYAGYYSLKLIENKAGVALGAAFNIIGGLRVDAIWGNYDREKYEAAISGILQTEPDKTVKLVSDGDEILNLFYDMAEFGNTQPDGSVSPELYMLFGIEEVEFFEIYKAVNKTIPGVNTGDVMRIVQRILSARDASELYLKGVRLCLNKKKDGSMMDDAAREILNYYDDNCPTLLAVVEELFAEVINGYAAKRIKAEVFNKTVLKTVQDQVSNPLKINGIYLTIAKTLLDECGMKNMTKAAELTSVCARIQERARATYLDSYEVDKKGVLKGEAAVDMKYATILYLRATQYAYSLYEFDRDLKGAALYWKQKTQEKIEQLAAYDDGELKAKVNNPYLDLSADGFRVLESGETMDGFAMADGEYRIYIHPETVCQTDAGWTFTADIYERKSFSNEQIESLRVGDRVENSTVDRVEWQDDGTAGGKTVKIGEYGPYFCYDPEKDCWYMSDMYMDDYVTEMVGRRMFAVIKGHTEIYDAFSPAMNPMDYPELADADFCAVLVDDLYDCLNAKDGFGYTPWYWLVSIKMEGGRMSRIVFEFVP